MRSFLYRNTAWLAVFWTAVIFVLCATPGEYIPSDDWMDLLSVDKFIHACMFFALTFVWFLHATKKGARMGVFIAIVCAGIMYGGLLEVMQARCFSNRSAEWMDFLANSIGCLTALLLRKRITGLYSVIFAE